MWRPGWEKVALLVKEKSLPGEIHMASVDCSQATSRQLCKDNGILGTPAIRVYHGTANMRNGYLQEGDHTVSQMPVIQTNKDAMSHLNREYHGHRMVDLVADWILAERRVKSNDDQLDQVATSIGSRIPGCEVTGTLKVTRAPGNFHLSCASAEHTFDATSVNTSHQVNGLYFGGELDAEDIRAIQTLKGK